MSTKHFRVEGQPGLHALLFVFQTSHAVCASFFFFLVEVSALLIQAWLKTVEGVEGPGGLPSDISRETLHQIKVLRIIKKTTPRLLRHNLSDEG